MRDDHILQRIERVDGVGLDAQLQTQINQRGLPVDFQCVEQPRGCVRPVQPALP
ncbi:hypothetical protein [uncultured Roseobacter sp.]|uniref:hypothetical protein n=1 Tax=uncultured Roseobacter sp. TaxID=114847 RepID=UPI00260A4E6C|nr:hypothetical protein [uncultured Roseobacter sp.]